MLTRNEVIEYCSTFQDVYEDYPFHDDNFTVMRCRKNKKSFAMIYERNGSKCINIKCDAQWVEFWRSAYQSVIPGYHMNKKYWNTIILDGSVPRNEIERMIAESYDLVKPRKAKNEP